MDSEPLTLEDFDALADEGARDAAIARALGWRPAKLREPDRCEHEPSHGYPIPCWVRGDVGPEPEWDNPNVWWLGTAPGHYTGGDADPFANWGLLAEVFRACGPATVLQGGGRSGSVVVPGHGNNQAAEGATPHRAACRALVAAGLVPREEAPDATNAP